MMSNRRKLITKLLFTGAALVYLLTAINSSGSYHPDEHYQIIEFAELKTGHNTADDLAWEYHARIRPAIQPALCFIIFQLSRALGINDPYDLTLVLRLITAACGISIIMLFSKLTQKTLPEKYHFPYLLLTCFLWFIPFINVRYSSETWAGLLFLLAMVIFHLHIRFTYFLMGCLLGLSFLFRFQTAFMTLGWLSWITIYGGTERRKLLYTILGILIVVIGGSFIDQWFYGEYVLTFVNYFKVNVIQGVATLFGVSPWYYYFTDGVRYAIIPIGLCLFFALAALLIFKPKHPLVWIIVPFLIGHMLVPHKELRFLFPVINFLPLLLISAYMLLEERAPVFFRLRWTRIGLGILFSIMLIGNGVGLFINMTSAAGNGTEKITQYIDRRFKGKAINLLYMLYTNPYQPNYPLRQAFYQNRHVETHQVRRLIEIKERLSGQDINLFVASKADVEVPDLRETLSALGFKVIRQSVPPWVVHVKNWFSYGLTDDTLLLYQR